MVKCCMGLIYSDCVCGNSERVIRAYIGGYAPSPMTPEQREWCIREADHAGEGYYTRGELTALDDKKLAYCVLNAWDMYVKSNCL